MSAASLVLRLALPAVLLAAVGCARNVTLSEWQGSVEHYITKESNGDPNALRNLAVDRNHRGFAVLGSSAADKGTDVKGVLLGHRSVGDRKWFIFLVGKVRRQVVDDVRLAALATDGLHYTWQWSGKDPEALRQYRQHKTDAWRELSSADAQPPPAFLGFPGEADAFHLSIDGMRITAMHPPSGAHWTLALAVPLATR